jgi:excisionase family DNA binding protein
MQPEEPPAPPYYSIAEAAAEKGVCYRTAWRAVQQGKLQAIRAGRGVLIPRAAVAAWKPAYERAPHAYRRHRASSPPAESDQPAREGPLASALMASSPALDQLKRWLLVHFVANPFLRDSAAGIARAIGANLEQVALALDELTAMGQLHTSILPDGRIIYAYRR